MAAIEEEIGRIVKSRLAVEGAIFLPEAGSLWIRRTPARRISSNRIVPLCRSVEFSSAQQGESLIDIIAYMTGCTAEQAEEVYHRWLDKNRDAQSGRIEIAGVGTLIQKGFRIDPLFDRQLNPQGRSERVLRRTTPWWLWSLTTLCIIFLIAGGIFWLDPANRWPEYFSPTPAPIEAPLPQPAQPDEPVAEQPAQTTAEPAAIVEQPAIVENPVSAPERPAPDEIERTRSGQSYVVLGIFSTEQNARRAIGQAVGKYDALTNDDCRIFRYGDKFLVSLGEAETRSGAQTEAARYREKGLADVWVYSKQ